MQCQIISIGDEILMGDTPNTNARQMGETLTEAGIEVVHVSTIKDDLQTIKDEVTDGLSSVDLVLTTGGLGPTHDDMTKQAIAELFNSPLTVHGPTLSFIKSMLGKRNIPFSESNYHQAEIPECSEPLINTHGTAPGLWIEADNASLAVLPGVPEEMKYLMREKVLPKVKEDAENKGFHKSHYMLTSGIGESTLSDEVIGNVSSYLGDHCSLAYLPGSWGTRIRITAVASSEEGWTAKVNPLISHIRDKAGKLIVGEQKGLTLPKGVGEVLKEQDLSISVAESCTGGAVTSALTDIPGSSAYFEGGIIAYANKVKKQQLRVTQGDLINYGAVSKNVALQMARGVAQEIQTDIGLSTTGIAGPDGGFEDKPVGTVWVGYWSKEQHFAIQTEFTKDRIANKQRTTALALEIVRRVLIGFSEMPYGLKKQQL